MVEHMAFTIVPLSKTPLMRTILPRGPFTAIPCTNGTSGSGFISNSSGSSDPTVYRSTSCNSFGEVHAVESKSLSPHGDSICTGTIFSFSSISSMRAVKLSTALTTLPRFPGSDIHGKVVQAVYKDFPEGTTVA
jgi:hypothetical protein